MFRNLFFVLIAIILLSLFHKCLGKKTDVAQSYNSTIFVVLVAYRDKNWPIQVHNMLSNACSPKSIRFGVLEFVADASEMNRVLGNWSKNVRIYTLSHNVASSLRKARALCIEKLYDNEEFTVLTRAGYFAKDWDSTLITNYTSNSILTSNMLDKLTFPVFRLKKKCLVVKNKCLQHSYGKNVPSLFLYLDFVFMSSEQIKLALHTSNEFDLVDHLKNNHISLFVPGVHILQHATHPIGITITQTKVASREQSSRFLNGDDNTILPSALYMGMVNDDDGEEAVTKYKSITEARIARQSYEASEH